jgi:hypothetical protein
MIRFISLPDVSSGIPYVNTDFTSVLQDEHIKSYGSILDGINQGSTSSTDPLNSGIVLKGCDILSSGGSSFNMGFTNSVVYIDGEFYQNNPSYTGNVAISHTTFYLIPGPTSSELRTLPILDGTTSTASNTRYFNWTQTPPTVPHIKFSSQGTSRYYKRILKYFTSRSGDVYMKRTLNGFDSNGVGFNDMEGFVVLDDSSGITGMPDLSGKFTRGWNSGLSFQGFKPGDVGGGSNSHQITPNESPPHQHYIGNTVFPSVAQYNTEQLFRHFHWMNQRTFFKSGQDEALNDPSAPLSETGNPNLIDPNSNNYPFVGENTDYINKNWEFFFPSVETGSVFHPGRPPSYQWDFGSSPRVYGWYNPWPAFTGGVHDLQNSELQTHKHTLPNDLGNGNVNDPGQAHENRPPYSVVVYYTKKLNS